MLAPPTMKEFPPHWPPAYDEDRVLDWLSKNGCPDGVDLLNGACAPMACAVGTHACQLLEQGTHPTTVARNGHSSFTTFEASGAEYQSNGNNILVEQIMAEIAQGASRLLSDLRSDGKALRLARCFVNVMDSETIAGAGPHCDLEASMGTVVVKLSGEDTL